MPTVAFAAPILPGKTGAFRELARELTEGFRADEMDVMQEKLGVHWEKWYVQETPDGTLAVIVFEADDPEVVMRELATSDDPSEVRMREKIREIHGIDLSDPEAAGPASEMVMDWTA